MAFCACLPPPSPPTFPPLHCCWPLCLPLNPPPACLRSHEQCEALNATEPNTTGHDTNTPWLTTNTQQPPTTPATREHPPATTPNQNNTITASTRQHNNNDNNSDTNNNKNDDHTNNDSNNNNKDSHLLTAPSNGTAHHGPLPTTDPQEPPVRERGTGTEGETHQVRCTPHLAPYALTTPQNTFP